MTQSITDKLSQALGATPRQGRRPGPPVVVATSAPPPTDNVRLSALSGPLQKLLSGKAPTVAEWRVLAVEVAGLTAAERSTLSTRLAGSNASLSVVAGGRYVLYRDLQTSVTVDVGTGRVRRTSGTRVELHGAERLEATMVAQDGHITVTRGKRTQVWDGTTGLGTENGRAIAIAAAAAVPGEAPREPWGIQPRNRFRLPRYQEGQPTDAFVRQVDEAVVRAGGRVLQPADVTRPEADWENCHSYALTRGTGDIANPFARTSMPRWLQSPMFQLATQGWRQLAPTQRVHPGDVVLYRDAAGLPAHTGIVREVDAAGNPSLIESKFGAWGVYLHKPFDVHPGYGSPADVFRAS